MKKPTQDTYGFGLVAYQIVADGQKPYDYETLKEILDAKAADRDLKALLGGLSADALRTLGPLVTAAAKYQPEDRASLDTLEGMLRDLARSLTE